MATSLQNFYKHYAPKNNSETSEEERRRIEREKLAEMQASISVPATSATSVETSAPVETVEPIETQEPIEEEAVTKAPISKYKDPELAAYMANYKPSAKPVDTPSPVTTAPVRYTKDYSLADLDKDKHFQGVADRFLQSISTDDDIYETLRDSDWSVTNALTRAYDSGKWTKQQKADYKYLRSKFDNADIGGFKHILEATKDIGIDIIADPLNWLAGLFIIGSGGLGVTGAAAVSRFAGTQAVSKIAGSIAIKEGAKKLAHHKGFRAVSMGLTEGAYDAGTINAGTQLTEIQTGIRQAGTKFSGTELALGVGIGAVAGGTLVGGAHKLTNYMLRKEHDKLAKTFDFKKGELLDKKGFIDPVKVKRLRKTLDKITSNTQGKVLTQYVEDAKDSIPFKQILLNLRADTFRRVFTARSEKIEKANATFSREADALSSTGATFIGEALAPLNRIVEGKNVVTRFFNSVAGKRKLSQEDDMAIWSLVARGNTLDKYITINPINKNLPLHNVKTVKTKRKLSQEDSTFLNQFNETQLEAAAKVRYYNQTIHKIGSEFFFQILKLQILLVIINLKLFKKEKILL